MKKILFSIAIIGLFLTTACGKKEEKPNNEIDNNEIVDKPIIESTSNTNANVINEQLIDGIKINNISLVTKGENSVFTADVTNTTSERSEVKSFDIIMKDKDGNVVIVLPGYIGNILEPNDSSTMTANVDMDLSSIASVEYIRNY